LAHYFRPRSRRGPRMLISDYLCGVTVEFYVTTEVFSATQIDDGTRLLIESARVPEEGFILDMGCGYGAIGITLAKAYPKLHVVMVDINPKAVELAKLNAKHNGVEDRVEVLHGDLYEPVRNRKFNMIISNPPLAAGMKTIERLILQAPQHLHKGGSLQIVMKKGAEKAKKLMEQAFGNVEILAKKKGYTVLYAEKR